VNVGRATTTIGGGGAEIDAGGKNTIEAISTTSGVVTGKAHAFGGVAIAVPHTRFKVGKGDYTATTEVSFGDYIILTGDTLNITAKSDSPQLQSVANARTGDLYGGGNVLAEMIVDDVAAVSFGNVSAITTHGNVVQVQSLADKVTANADAKARTLIGGDYAGATTDLTRTARILGHLLDDLNHTTYTVSAPPASTLVEHHKSVTYYVWFIKHKNEGGNPSETINLTPSALDLPVQVPRGLAVVSPDMLPLVGVRNGRMVNLPEPEQDLAFSSFDWSGSADAASANHGISATAIDAAMSDPSLLRSEGRLPPRSARHYYLYRFHVDELPNIDLRKSPRGVDQAFGDSHDDWWNPFHELLTETGDW
jgi:hypothetical protein